MSLIAAVEVDFGVHLDGTLTSHGGVKPETENRELHDYSWAVLNTKP